MNIQRNDAIVSSVTCGTTTGGSDAVNIEGFGGGHIIMPAGTTGTLTFYSASSIDGTYQEIYKVTNASTVITLTANKNYPLPDEVFGVPFLKIVKNGSAITVDLCLVV